MTQLSSPSAGPLRTSGRSPLRRLVDLFSNVWLGVFWAALLFVYCSIGSAVPAVRQLPALEMTEFEWFHWWPFDVLVILLCLTMVTVTVRRIPFRLVNLGVWMIHGGIIVLCIGSYYYFSTKVEGDAPVFRRRVRIELPGTDTPEYMVALPGNQLTVAAGPDVWRFSVQSTNSAWPILSGKHKGKKAYAVTVLVTPPAGDPFARQLLDGFPQFTEDIIPGKGRAVKSIGRKLVNEDLKLSLDYEPQEYFHVMQTWALFTRRVGEKEWVERPIRGLPRYNDWIASRDQVFTDPHYPLELRSLDLKVPAIRKDDPLRSLPVHISGYLRYAQMRRQWRDGGERLNPVLRATILPEHGRRRSLELVAFDRVHSRSQDGLVEFVWLDDASEIKALPTDSQAVLHIEVPEAKLAQDVPITPEHASGRERPFTQLEGTGFAYRILRVEDNLSIPGRRQAVSIAMVEIQTPEGRFTRMVADRPEMTRDMHGEADPHMAGAKEPQQPDPRIRMTYRPQSAPIIFAAYPAGLYLAVNGQEERLLGRDIKLQESVEVTPGLSVRADALWTRAFSQVKPYVVPPESRRRDTGETFSMIRLEVNTGNDTQAKWLHFNQYVFPDRQYAYSGRFAYSPEVFHLPDGSLVEVVFSRQRRKLPAAIALEDFTLDTHLGGYTGQALTIRNYVSKLRFLDRGKWTDPTPIKVNAPTEFGGYWYFQSMWDKPPSADPSGGMNYTGLGVGNRNGVYVQLAGCCIAVAGMLFAFYVKPVLKRRRHEQVRARTPRPQGEAIGALAEVSISETVEA